MGEISGCCSIAVVGAGAAGTLVAAQLAVQAGQRQQPLEIVLIDPRPRTGEGVAYSTTDPRHRLNVSAGRISAWPDQEDHFLQWLRVHAPEYAEPAAFAPRMLYGDYLRDVLDESLATAGDSVRLERVVDEVTGLVPLGRRWRVRVGQDGTRYVDAVVLALGSGQPDDGWAPGALRRSPHFVADPWAEGALDRLRRLDGDLVLVGTGLTMVDLASALARPGRTVHAISRHGLLPSAHRVDLVTPAAPPELPDGDLTLAALTETLSSHVAETTRRTGDWRPAIDGLRPLNSTLWQRLSLADREQFLAGAARTWEVRRHRMAAPVAQQIAALRQSGALTVRAGQVAGVAESSDRAAGAARRRCADRRRRGGQLHRAARPGAAPGQRSAARPVDLRTRPAGSSWGSDWTPTRPAAWSAGDGNVQAGLWGLGALRRGQLYESTAIPEIRAQARDLAATVISELPQPQTVRRPRDRYGLAMSASPEAAIAYSTALEALLRVQSGAEISLQHAAAVDPGFALGSRRAGPARP